MSTRHFHWLLAFAFACGGDGGGDEPSGSGAEHLGHQGGDASISETADPEADVPCTVEYPPFRAGMSVKAADFTVTVAAAEPAPPRQKVANDWTIDIRDASGAPLAGASLSNAASYMEVHRHFGKTPPTVSALSTPGQYKLDDIDFKMRGPWEVLFDIEGSGTSVTPVRIKICVE